MYTAQTNHNITANDNSILFIILQLLGLGIVNYCILQNDLNGIIRLQNGNSQPQQPTEAQM